jgi:HEAT repeat protein
MQRNPAPEFRRYAAAALGEIGEYAIEPLIGALATEDAALRGFVSRALCRIGKPAVGPLSQRLNDPDEILRSCASLTLLQMEEGVSVMLQKTAEEKERKG